MFLKEINLNRFNNSNSCDLLSTYEIPDTTLGTIIFAYIHFTTTTLKASYQLPPIREKITKAQENR